MEDFENLLVELQAFKSNRVKDNQERRGNLEFLEKCYDQLDL